MFGIDFLVKEVMLPILEFFHGLSGSYGWAIILLTIFVKMMLMPLTFQHIKATIEMQKIQPKLKEIQEKYKNRPEVYNKKIMELYRENKVNPLGGCLPILIQMPFFIALYSSLMSESFKAKSGHASFFFIQDLSRVGIVANNQFYFDNLILVLIFGVTTFISQKMMITNPNDPMQKQMLQIMPVMLTLMFMFFPIPSGVLLYIAVSNIFTIGQNFIVIKKRKSLEITLGSASTNANIIDKEKDSSINLSKSAEKDSSSDTIGTNSKSARARKNKKNRKK